MIGGPWLFDVDGCLVDSLTGSSLRPLAREILVALAAAGREALMWSAGGAEHARRMAQRHGIAVLVSGCYDKLERGADGRWLLAHLTGCSPAVCVDDRPEEAPSGIDVMAVSPYVAPDPHDRGLCAVLAAARALRG